MPRSYRIYMTNRHRHRRKCFSRKASRKGEWEKKEEKSRRLVVVVVVVWGMEKAYNSPFFPPILVCTWKTTITLFHSTFSATYTFSGEGAIISPLQYNFQPSTSHNFSIIMVFSHIHSLYKQTCKHNWRKLRAIFPHIILHFFGRSLFWKCLILDICVQ